MADDLGTALEPMCPIAADSPWQQTEPAAPVPRACAPTSENGDPEEGGGSNRPRPEAGGTRSAVDVLMLRCRLHQLMKDVQQYRNILIIEDDQSDSDRLVSTLRSIFGYEVIIRQCKTLGTALDAVMADQPDLVFLDDRLGPADRAERSVPFLRTAGCQAMILVVSGVVDRRRRAALLQLRIADVIHKDELDSTSICMALVAHEQARKPST